MSSETAESKLDFLAIVWDLVTTHGVDAAMGAISAFKVKNPTSKDFEELRNLVKKPEEYFNQYISN